MEYEASSDPYLIVTCISNHFPASLGRGRNSWSQFRERIGNRMYSLEKVNFLELTRSLRYSGERPN